MQERPGMHHIILSILCCVSRHGCIGVILCQLWACSWIPSRDSVEHTVLESAIYKNRFATHLEVINRISTFTASKERRDGNTTNIHWKIIRITCCKESSLKCCYMICSMDLKETWIDDSEALLKWELKVSRLCCYNHCGLDVENLYV